MKWYRQSAYYSIGVEERLAINNIFMLKKATFPYSFGMALFTF